MECPVYNKIGVLLLYYLAWANTVFATHYSGNGRTGPISNPSVILSKLSDADIIKLLNTQTYKTNYDIKDVASLVHNFNKNHSPSSDGGSRFKIVSNGGGDRGPQFRLENKKVSPFAESKSDYTALMKLSGILNNNEEGSSSSEQDADRELMFDVLVSQLKALCFKKAKKNKAVNGNGLLELLKGPTSKESVERKSELDQKEHLFLILNDELHTHGPTDELVFVDPDSLTKNSSVLVLGSLSNSLSNREVKSVMDSVTEELHKPSYFSMLKELASIQPSDLSKSPFVKNFVTGPQSRRYIKPHRCNYQSPLARLHGGPRWIICTGYLNLNTPSIYD